jgi:hypothetical protein
VEDRAQEQLVRAAHLTELRDRDAAAQVAHGPALHEFPPLQAAAVGSEPSGITK